MLDQPDASWGVPTGCASRIGIEPLWGEGTEPVWDEGTEPVWDEGTEPM